MKDSRIKIVRGVVLTIGVIALAGMFLPNLERWDASNAMVLTLFMLWQAVPYIVFWIISIRARDWLLVFAPGFFLLLTHLGTIWWVFTTSDQYAYLMFLFAPGYELFFMLLGMLFMWIARPRTAPNGRPDVALDDFVE